MSLIGLLLALLVVCVILWAARALMAAFGVGDPMATVVYVVLVLVCLLYVLGQFGLGPSMRLG